MGRQQYQQIWILIHATYQNKQQWWKSTFTDGAWPEKVIEKWTMDRWESLQSLAKSGGLREDSHRSDPELVVFPPPPEDAWCSLHLPQPLETSCFPVPHTQAPWDREGNTSSCQVFFTWFFWVQSKPPISSKISNSTSTTERELLVIWYVHCQWQSAYKNCLK